MKWTNSFAKRTGQMRRTAVREFIKLASQPGMISFAGGLPAEELFPIEQMKRAANAVLSNQGSKALQYGETEGVGALRDWIAMRYRTPAIKLSRENVIVTSGGQQALDLIGRILLNEGDEVIVENPTYLALLSAWRPLGVRFVPATSDVDGMRMDQMKRLLREGPKLVYTMPNFQNPQGTTFARERRMELVEECRGHGVGLVEDNAYGELRYSGDPLPHLFELDAACHMDGNEESNVIFVGTFSKVLTPGLRIGWVIAAESVVEKLLQAKQAADLHTSTFNQHLTLQLLQDGVLEKQLPVLRQAYRVRRDAMLSALEQHFPAEATWTRPDGGMFLLVTLPAGLDACEVLRRAIARQVAFVPGDDFYLDGSGRNRLRLNFSNAMPELIEEGIRRLGRVVKEMTCAVA